jgi:CheY-like chemotaxis protein
MESRHRILLVDDDPDLLQMYREILRQLPSQPEIRTANSGSRALALIASEPFRLLLCDLKMPKVDGLQVLSIVRRKYPQLRTVAMTSVADEQFRSRAYALGVDLFWHKPATEEEVQMFMECIESLLGPESDTGFRGIQSKSLVDIIQLECISQSSSLLRITNGPLTGKIWIQDGEVIDAEADELRGEPAFLKILSWKAGHFESLPPDPSRPRTIFKSYNALLLESAQALDESVVQDPTERGNSADEQRLAQLSQLDGMEFVLAMTTGEESARIARGLENAKSMTQWAKTNLERFRGLGERLQAGPLEAMEGLGPQRNVALQTQGDTEFCVGWRHTMSPDEMGENMKKVMGLWVC